MKKVFHDSQVAHLWANKSQPEARTPRGNFYFNGPTIYSYGVHFPIAAHVTGTNGRAGVILTTARYSVTTSGHVSTVRGALRGLPVPVFYVSAVPSYAPDRAELRQLARAEQVNFKRQLPELILAASRKIKENRARALEHIAHTADAVNEFAAFVGVRSRVIAPADLTAATEAAKAALARRSAAEKRAEAQREKQSRERLAQRLAEWHEHAAEWRAGNRPSLSSCPDWKEEQTFLRLTPDGETVQTSRGAEVPAEDARRVLALAQRCREHGKAWKPEGLNGCAVGAFTVSEVSATGDVKAGCHFLPWAEIERFAASVGWLPAESLACAA